METPNNNQQTTGLQIFFKEDIDANVRVKVINGAPWFVGKDVAASLGYTKTRNAISQHVDNEDALKQGVPDNQGFIQETILINESGMYALIFGSKLPTAKAFKRWVTNEVLPSIRRTGAYSVCPTQRPTLPAPKFRPDFIEWKRAVCRYLNRNDLKTVATNMKVTYSHVCKVYSGNTMSRRIADRLTKLAISHKNKGIIYSEPVPVYRQLLIEWEEQG